MLTCELICKAIVEWQKDLGKWDLAIRRAAKVLTEHLKHIDCKSHFENNINVIASTKQSRKKNADRVEHLVALAAQAEAVFFYHLKDVLVANQVYPEKGMNLRYRLLANALDVPMNGSAPEEVIEGYDELSRRLAKKRAILT